MNVKAVNMIAPKLLSRLEKMTHSERSLLAKALNPEAEMIEYLTALSAITEGQRAFVGVKAKNPALSDKAAAREAGLRCVPGSERVDRALALALEWEGAFGDMTDQEVEGEIAKLIRQALDLKLKLDACKEYNKLKGRYPAQKHEVSGKDGQPIQSETKIIYGWAGDLEEDDGNGDKESDTLHSSPTPERSPRGRFADPSSRLAP
ncbi:MAG: hypothetical protein E3J81_03530 [Dehalococcoidia bacterium]|nr:MAG: hypothetical protein E3J81_03530 [Dehalococcoidia bacterium]